MLLTSDEMHVARLLDVKWVFKRLDEWGNG